MSGLSLKTAATFFNHESFSAWDPVTDTFIDPFIGKLRRIDRFQTIYHRPTRRQTLSCQQPTSVASGVLRHDPSGDLFIVSDSVEPEYWKGEQVYEYVSRLNRVEAPSGGLGDYHQAQVLGTGDDLGEVVLAAAEPIYYDLELRTTRNEAGLEEVITAEVIGTLSKNAVPEPGDFYLLSGDYYRVGFVYADAGFQMARLFKEDPAFETVTYQFGTATNAVYDPVTGTMTPATTATRLVSAIPGDREVKRGPVTQELTQMVRLYIYQRHIGFVPKVDDKLEFDGQPFTVRSVSEDKQERQWIVEVGL